MNDCTVLGTTLSELEIRESIVLPQLAEVSELCVVDSIASTNDYLLQLPASSRLNYVVCVANQQTAGRGRKGRQWQSPADANIYLSVGCRFQGKAAAQLSCLSLACGVAVCRLLEAAGLKPKLKWPNDILLDDCKLAGILVETRVSSNEVFAVIGLGLNVVMPPKSADIIDQSWVDLQSVLPAGSVLLNRNQLAGKLVTALCEACQQYQQSAMAGFLEDWQRFDILKGRDVAISDSQGNEFVAQVEGITSDCALQVEMDGIEQQVYEADVKLKMARHDCD